MDQLTKALVLPFAVSLAIQRLVEVVDSVVVALLGKDPTSPWKKASLGALALAVATAVAVSCDWLRVLGPVARLSGTTVPEGLDVVVTVLVTSAGTEAFNSILKFLAYAKVEKKENAKDAHQSGTERDLVLAA